MGIDGVVERPCSARVLLRERVCLGRRGDVQRREAAVRRFCGISGGCNLKVLPSSTAPSPSSVPQKGDDEHDCSRHGSARDYPSV